METENLNLHRNTVGRIRDRCLRQGEHPALNRQVARVVQLLRECILRLLFGSPAPIGNSNHENGIRPHPQWHLPH